MKNFFTRYERHFDVPEIGVEGQKKLAAASVLVVGLGGLGCPAALYLAAAGIGRIGLVDQDTVSASNLQRQILYREDDLGHPKSAVAARALKAHASACTVEEHPFFLTPGNAGELIGGYDIVLDCTDNFDSRYTVNHAAVREGRPLVSASIYHLDGQLAVFRGHQEHLPCYQCAYPRSDMLAVIPQCKEGGILGPVAGIFGTLQAVTAINELLGIGESLAGSLWNFNTLDFSASKIKIMKRHDCDVCSNPQGAALQPSTACGL